MKRVCVHSFFYYNELFYVVVKKCKRYFNVSLKSVLFLSLFAANFGETEWLFYNDILCEKYPVGK